jgi:hypothetical protein
MNPRVYDLSMLTGLVLVVGGVYRNWGSGWSCIAAGSLILILTAFGARR